VISMITHRKQQVSFYCGV